MTKKFFAIGALAFTLFAFIAPERVEAQWDFIKETDWNEMYKGRKMVDSKIKKGDFYVCDALFVIKQSAVPGNPAEYGALQDKNGKRRPPMNEGEFIHNSNIVKVDCPGNIYMRFVVFQDIGEAKNYFSLNPKTRLLELRGGTIAIEEQNKRYGFRLVSGSLWEDTNFKTAASTDQVMDIYASVIDDPGWMQMDIEKMRKTFNNDNDKVADNIITRWTTLATGLGVLSGAAPLWALPAEYAVDFVENLNKARMAWAISQAYGEKLSDIDFKHDLYVLLGADDVSVTLKNIAKVYGVAAAQSLPFEVLSKEGIVKKIGSSKAFQSTVMKVMPDKWAAKITAKGVTKGVAIAAILFGGGKAFKSASSFGKQAKQYYRTDFSGTWHIVAKNGTALKVKENSDVIVINKNYSANEKQTQWSLARESDGTYIITNVNSGKVIDVPGGSKKSGEGLIQYNNQKSGNQKWRVEKVEGDYVSFVNVNSGKIIDVPNNTNVNDTQVIQWDSNKGNGQQFKLVKVK